MNKVEKFSHVKEFVLKKAYGLDYAHTYKLLDNFTGNGFPSNVKIEGHGTVEMYEDMPELSTGKVGTYANSETVSQFLSTPKTVQDGRLGMTNHARPLTAIDLEKSK